MQSTNLASPNLAYFDPGDGRLVRVSETEDVPHLDRARASSAKSDFHDVIRDHVAAHEQLAAYSDPESRYQIHSIVGTHQPTWQSARPAGDGVELLYTRDGVDADGDGTVPRPSATPSPRDAVCLIGP